MSRVYLASKDEAPDGVTVRKDDDGELFFDPSENRGVEKRRVYVDSPEEVPEQYEVQEGAQGGYYYETGSGGGDSGGSGDGLDVDSDTPVDEQAYDMAEQAGIDSQDEAVDVAQNLLGDDFDEMVERYEERYALTFDEVAQEDPAMAVADAFGYAVESEIEEAGYRPGDIPEDEAEQIISSVGEDLNETVDSVDSDTDENSSSDLESEAQNVDVGESAIDLSSNVEEMLDGKVEDIDPQEVDEIAQEVLGEDYDAMASLATSGEESDFADIAEDAGPVSALTEAVVSATQAGLPRGRNALVTDEDWEEAARRSVRNVAEEIDQRS